MAVRRKPRGHGARLLAGLFLLERSAWHWTARCGLNSPLFLLRVAFDHLLGVALGIAMVVLVLEGARARTEELNDKMRRLTSADGCQHANAFRPGSA